MGILARLVHDGQATGEVRPGKPDVIAHLYCVLINEFALLSADQAVAPVHHLAVPRPVDGALRVP
jgi:hypothetical protein